MDFQEQGRPALEAFDDLVPGLQEVRDKINEKIQPLVVGDKHANYQTAYLLGRIEDVQLITKRLITQNQRLIDLAWMDEAITPVIRPRHQFSKRRQSIHKEMHLLEIKMRLDLESLYIYGNFVLDHWAAVVGFLRNIPQSASWDHPYTKLHTELVAQQPNDSIASVKAFHADDIYWLLYNLREYRNKFIEHLDRPIQKGSGRSVFYMGFYFFMPAAGGSLTDEQIAAHYASIAHLDAQFTARLSADSWQRKPRAVLQMMMHRIDTIEQLEDRKAVLKAWKAIGGDSVSYEVLIRRLTKLLNESIATITNDGSRPDTSHNLIRLQTKESL
jgi:hypothetical protein